MVRNPVVSGQFYPSDKKVLLEQLDLMIPKVAQKVNAIGAVSPHAGYLYSGKTAGEVYGRLSPKETYVIISPNHTGYGGHFAASGESWKTPLGEIPVDSEFLRYMIESCTAIEDDSSAHVFEHSVEVQLPFIQKSAPDAKIVPVTVKHGDFHKLDEIAGAILRAKENSGRDIIVVASSDMSHYEPRKIATKKDMDVIKKIVDLDVEGFLDVVESRDVSMCGYIPTAIMLMYANKIGAKKGELVKYSDSGDETGDITEVVGYAGIIVS